MMLKVGRARSYPIFNIHPTDWNPYLQGPVICANSKKMHDVVLFYQPSTYNMLS